MTQSVFEAVITIAVVAVVTLLTRVLPFLLFSSKKETPKIITYLGKVLPFAAIAMLVIFCLKGVSVLSYPNGIPEAIALVGIIALHKWKHNMLISIGGGTVIYMLLVQFVFV